MALAFRCSQCGKTYSKGDDWAGKVIPCEGCGKAMRIPTPRVGTPVAETTVAARGAMPDRAQPAGPEAVTRPRRPVDDDGSADVKTRGAASGGPDAGKKPSLLKTILGGAFSVLVVLGMIGRFVIRPYRAWQKAQAAQQQNQPFVPQQAVPLLQKPGAPAPLVSPARGPWRMPALPDLGDPTQLEPGVEFYEVHLPGGGQVGNPLTMPGHGGKLWLYLPEGDHAPRSLPCILIAGAGTNLMTGMTLGDGDRPEHLPYVRAGFAVLAYELDGMLPDPPPKDDASFAPYIRAFVDAEAGLVNMRVALQFATTKVPQIDPKRFYAAGHSSAATLALLVAESEPRIAECVAYAPVVDVAEHIPAPARQVVSMMVPGADQLFTRFNPHAGESKIQCPLFLFVARDDPLAQQDGELAGRLVAMGKKVNFTTVQSGGHYNPMIRTGIPKAIAWLKSLHQGPDGTAASPARGNPLPRTKTAPRRTPGMPNQPGARRPRRGPSTQRRQQPPGD
jgi:dienelactone hydrolase